MDIRSLLADPQFRLGLGLLGAAGPAPASQSGLGQRLGRAMGSYDEWDITEQKRKILEREEARREEESRYQNLLRQAQAQRQKALTEKGVSPDLPANVQTAEWYMNATPEQRRAFDHTVRASEKVDIGGVPHFKNPLTGQWDPIKPIQDVISNIESTVGAQERTKAQFDLIPGTDASGRAAFGTRYKQLQSMGAVPPRIPTIQNLPQQTPVPDATAPIGAQPRGPQPGGIKLPEVVQGAFGPNDAPPVLRSVIEAQGGGGALRPPSAATARTRADEEYAKDLSTFLTDGYSDTISQIQSLRRAEKKLQTSSDLTGPVYGMLPDKALAFVSPDAVDTKDAVASVVTRGMKNILGTQYTQKEGENLIARAYNPSLPEAYNLRRVNRLIKQMTKAAAAKKSAAEYFQKNSTLAGWQGAMPSMSDFETAIDNEKLDNEPDLGEERFTKSGGKVRWDGAGWRPVK